MNDRRCAHGGKAKDRRRLQTAFAKRESGGAVGERRRRHRRATDEISLFILALLQSKILFIDSDASASASSLLLRQRKVQRPGAEGRQGRSHRDAPQLFQQLGHLLHRGLFARHRVLQRHQRRQRVSRRLRHRAQRPEGHHKHWQHGGVAHHLRDVAVLGLLVRYALRQLAVPGHRDLQQHPDTSRPLGHHVHPAALLAQLGRGQTVQSGQRSVAVQLPPAQLIG
eukprot:scaffold1376_cov257-Pinguiococcus_pyrenoidosus.AAC.24